ncbi:hypothetical protein fHeYen902_284 [Yersinia phage fHe-Yen9-02]|nr:hypothetical protein fHeYen902_284 [Yersinia phage fHe-Yen9-02]
MYLLKATVNLMPDTGTVCSIHSEHGILHLRKYIPDLI